MHQVSIEEAKIRLPDLIDAAVSGEEVVIARGDRQLVRLVPVLGTKSRPQFGSAEGLISMSEEFEEPLEDFEEYTR
jgi:antitoxin (DNA-binding transcriptional repressor) of toxin-antitoxin stability system